jgi:hypothetical protein
VGDLLVKKHGTDGRGSGSSRAVPPPPRFRLLRYGGSVVGAVGWSIGRRSVEKGNGEAGRAGAGMSDALINGLAGAGGGIIAQLLTYPLQTVRHAPATYLSLGLPALWLLRVY